MIAPVKVQWLHANESGLSCFDTLEIERELTDFVPPTQPFPVSKSIPASRFVVLQLPVGWSGERHPTPIPGVTRTLPARLRPPRLLRALLASLQRSLDGHKDRCAPHRWCAQRPGCGPPGGAARCASPVRPCRGPPRSRPSVRARHERTGARACGDGGAGRREPTSKAPAPRPPASRRA